MASWWNIACTSAIYIWGFLVMKTWSTAVNAERWDRNIVFSCSWSIRCGAHSKLQSCILILRDFPRSLISKISLLECKIWIYIFCISNWNSSKLEWGMGMEMVMGTYGYTTREPIVVLMIVIGSPTWNPINVFWVPS